MFSVKLELFSHPNLYFPITVPCSSPRCAFLVTETINSSINCQLLMKQKQCQCSSLQAKIQLHFCLKFCDFKSLSVSSQGVGYGYSLHGEELVKKNGCQAGMAA